MEGNSGSYYTEKPPLSHKLPKPQRAGSWEHTFACFSRSSPSTCFWPLSMCSAVRRTSTATREAALSWAGHEHDCEVGTRAHGSAIRSVPGPRSSCPWGCGNHRSRCFLEEGDVGAALMAPSRLSDDSSIPLPVLIGLQASE